MTKWFKEQSDAAEPGEKAAIRALQAWQFLIAKAANRQIARYEELRELMEYPTSNPLASILGCIMFYCDQSGLPPLTIIVVNQSGVPGAGFTAEPIESYHQRREDVFSFPWFRLVPPTVPELLHAMKSGHAKQEQA